MAKAQHLSSYQRSIVNRYYEHLDTITVQKLGEAVSDLFLATTPAAADKLWKSVEASLRRAKVDDASVTKVTASRDVRALAALVNDLSAGGKPSSGGSSGGRR